MLRIRRLICLLTLLYFLLQQSFTPMDAELVSLTIGAGAISALGMFISDFGGLYSKAKCKCEFHK
jgi:hypothetical protein